MPRAADMFPSRRGGNDVHSPLRGLLDYTTPLAMTAQAAGEGIRRKIEDVVAYIRDTTGIDLTGFTDLLNGLETATGLNLFELADLNLTDNIPQLIAALQGIDWSQPGAIKQAIVDLAASAPVIGPILAALIGQAIPDDADPLGFVQDWADNLRSILPGVDLTLPPDLFNPTAALSNFVTFGLSPLKLLLGTNDPIPGGNIFGTIPLAQFAGGVSITDLTTAATNLLQPFSARGAADWEDGWSYNATEDAAQVVADGTTKTLWLKSGVIKVEPDQPLNLSVPVRYAGVTSGPGQTIRLVVDTYTVASPTNSSVATPVVIAAITNPAGTITTPVTLGNPAWPIPPGVQSVRPRMVVDELVTDGVVYWRNVPQLHKSATGILARTLGDIQTALNNAGQATRDAIANALGHPGSGHTIADILSYLQNIPRNIINGLDDIFDEITNVFDGNPVIPANPVSDALKNFYDFWFGGGPNNVVSQKQIAAPSGAAPTDANNTIPFKYFPEQFAPVAIGHPWVELTKVGAQTINKGLAQKVTGWTQAGGFPLAEPVGSEFRVPFDGLFHIKAKANWAVSPDTYGRLYLSVGGNYYRTDHRITDGMSSISYNEIDEFVPLSAGDNIAFYVHWDGTGTTRDISPSPLSYVRITYIGATHLTAVPIPTPTATFDAKGTADNGSGDAGWNHTFGPNAKTIVIPYSHEAPELPTIKCGPYNVPVLSGPTFIGNYFGFNARYSLAAAILPDAVKGTTQPITVDFPSGNAAFSGNSLSFNNVSYLGAVRVSNGNGGGGDPARILVPSNAFSQVAGGFGGMDANFSSFNRTQDNIWNFIAGNTWAHVIGHAQGGLEFIASGGKWAGKFIELHP